MDVERRQPSDDVVCGNTTNAPATEPSNHPEETLEKVESERLDARSGEDICEKALEDKGDVSEHVKGCHSTADNGGSEVCTEDDSHHGSDKCSNGGNDMPTRGTVVETRTGNPHENDGGLVPRGILQLSPLAPPNYTSFPLPPGKPCPVAKVGMPLIATSGANGTKGKNSSARANKCAGERGWTKSRLTPSRAVRNVNTKEGKTPHVSPWGMQSRESQYRIVYGGQQNQHRAKRSDCQRCNQATRGGPQDASMEDDTALSFSGHIHDAERQLHKYLFSFNAKCEEFNSVEPTSSYQTTYGSRKGISSRLRAGERPPPFTLGDPPKCCADPLLSVNRQLSEYSSRQRHSNRSSPTPNTNDGQQGSRGVTPDCGCTWEEPTSYPASHPQYLGRGMQDELQHCARLLLERFDHCSERRDLGYSYRCIMVGRQKPHFFMKSARSLPVVRWEPAKGPSPAKPPFRHRMHDVRASNGSGARTSLRARKRLSEGHSAEVNERAQTLSPHPPSGPKSSEVGGKPLTEDHTSGGTVTASVMKGYVKYVETEQNGEGAEPKVILCEEPIDPAEIERLSPASRAAAKHGGLRNDAKTEREKVENLSEAGNEGSSSHPDIKYLGMASRTGAERDGLLSQMGTDREGLASPTDTSRKSPGTQNTNQSESFTSRTGTDTDGGKLVSCIGTDGETAESQNGVGYNRPASGTGTDSAVLTSHAGTNAEELGSQFVIQCARPPSFTDTDTGGLASRTGTDTDGGKLVSCIGTDGETAESQNGVGYNRPASGTGTDSAVLTSHAGTNAEELGSQFVIQCARPPSFTDTDTGGLASRTGTDTDGGKLVSCIGTDGETAESQDGVGYNRPAGGTGTDSAVLTSHAGTNAEELGSQFVIQCARPPSFTDTDTGGLASRTGTDTDGGKLVSCIGTDGETAESQDGVGYNRPASGTGTDSAVLTSHAGTNAEELGSQFVIQCARPPSYAGTDREEVESNYVIQNVRPVSRPGTGTSSKSLVSRTGTESSEEECFSDEETTIGK